MWKASPLYFRVANRAFQVSTRNICTSNALRKNLYEALELTRNATQTDIKNAYFELSKKYHPDRIAATDENLNRFREICAAYEILGNEQSRKLYDTGLLGDFKRVGAEEEISDPIIKFYKQRHELAKPFLKREGQEEEEAEVKAWVARPKKFGKAKLAEKYNYFRHGTFIKYPLEEPFYYSYSFLVIMFATMLFAVNFEGTIFRKIWRKIFYSENF